MSRTYKQLSLEEHSLLQARRAASMEPSEALRAEENSLVRLSIAAEASSIPAKGVH